MYLDSRNSNITENEIDDVNNYNLNNDEEYYTSSNYNEDYY